MRITIDGKRFEVEGKKTLLEIARENGIAIPHLCDHPHLAPFSGCRLCIVEIQGRKGFVPSCSTYAEDGMEVRTDSRKVQKLRKQILQLILTEHPDACLVCTEKASCDEYKSTIRKVGEVTGCVLCPNNGRCELQDVVEAVGLESVEFPSLYRGIELKRNDPFFDRNYNLCILCGRCVRVCHEIRGASTIAFSYRGSEAVISTALDRPLLESGCQFCGACVDVCPTGALTERAVRYEPLPDGQAETVCPFCSVGCALDVRLFGERILWSQPAEAGPVNRGQACVKGRFAVRDAVANSRRILRPMIRRKKNLEEVSWDEALEFLTQKLKAYTGKEVAVIPSAQTSCEDSFVFHRFARDVLKTRNIVSPSGVSPLEAAGRIGQKTGVWFPLNFRFEEVECARVILVVGADPAESHPILWLHILKAVRGGADLVFVGPAAPIGLRHVSLWLQTHPGTEDIVCDFLAKRLIEKGHGKKKEDMAGFSSYRRAVGRMALSQVVSSTGVSPGVVDQAVERLSKGGVFIVAGAGLTQFPSGERNLVSLWNLGLLVNSRVFLLGLESNSRGMFEIQKGLALRVKSMEKIREAIRSGQVKAIYAAGPLPLGKKDKVEFLIIQDSYMSEAAERADVVLPAATFAESAGTFVNAEGRIQSFPAVVPPRGEAKPDWWILTRLAERRGRKDFRYPRVADIRRDIKTLLPGFRKLSLSGRRRRQPVFIQEESKPQERFLPLQPREPGVKTSRSYPFLLWAEYGLDSYRNLVLAHEVKGLRIIRNPRWFRIHPEDAQKAGIEDGQTVEVLSRLGKTRGIGKVSTAVPRGVITAHLLWGEASEFSLVPHVSSPAQASSSISLIPVNIKRGE